MNIYKEIIKTLANDGRSAADRSNVIIREICRLTSDICDYNYAVDHYKGNGTVIEDKQNQIKNSLALVLSDLSIYAEQLGITEDVETKVKKRLEKLNK